MGIGMPITKTILPHVEKAINGYRESPKTSSLAKKIQKAGPVFLSKLEEALKFRLENLKHKFSEWILDSGFNSVRDFGLRKNPNYNRGLYSINASFGTLLDSQGPDLFRRAEMFETILIDNFFTKIFLDGVKYGNHATYPGVCELDHQFILKLLDEKYKVRGEEIKNILDIGVGANDWLYPAITPRELTSLINQGSYPNIKQIIAMDVCFSALRYTKTEQMRAADPFSSALRSISNPDIEQIPAMDQFFSALKYMSKVFSFIVPANGQTVLPPIIQERLNCVEANPIDSIPIKPIVDVVICKNVKKFLNEEGSSTLDKNILSVLREGGFYISNSRPIEEGYVYLKINGEFERIGQLPNLINLNMTMAQYLDAPEGQRLSTVGF